MSMRSTFLMATIAVAIGLTGCASTQRGDDLALFDEASGQSEATIRVTNNNWSEMTVFILRSGMRTRLGNVGSMSSGQFSLPSGVLASSVRLMAVPLAARRGYVSQTMSILPGQQVVLKLENNLNLSSFQVY
jgi:hypothetical protein